MRDYRKTSSKYIPALGPNREPVCEKKKAAGGKRPVSLDASSLPHRSIAFDTHPESPTIISSHYPRHLVALASREFAISKSWQQNPVKSLTLPVEWGRYRQVTPSKDNLKQPPVFQTAVKKRQDAHSPCISLAHMPTHIQLSTQSDARRHLPAKEVYMELVDAVLRADKPGRPKPH